MSNNSSDYDKYFDLDARADLLASSHTPTGGVARAGKDLARYIYRMKVDAHELKFAAFSGDSKRAGIDPSVANIAYLAPGAKEDLARMKEWDDELLAGGKPFEIRYFWNVARPSGVRESRYWLARLDIYFVRGEERRKVAMLVNSLLQTPFLQGLNRVPSLLLLPIEPGVKEPDLEVDLNRVRAGELPFIFIELGDRGRNTDLTEYLETLDQLLAVAEQQKIIQRQDKPSDPLSVFKPYKRGKPKKE